VTKLKLTFDIKLNTKEVLKMGENAGRMGLRDTIIAVLNDSIKPPSPYLTGNNRRSMAAEVSGMGKVQQGMDAIQERYVDDNKLEAAVFSTSGYGGFLETGTVRMGARPYMKPAMDKNQNSLFNNIKKYWK